MHCLLVPAAVCFVEEAFLADGTLERAMIGMSVEVTLVMCAIYETELTHIWIVSGMSPHMQPVTSFAGEGFHADLTGKLAESPHLLVHLAGNKEKSHYSCRCTCKEWQMYSGPIDLRPLHLTIPSIDITLMFLI